MGAKTPDFVLVGEVLRPHGIRGELRVACHADSPFLFDAVPRVWLRPGPGSPAPAPAPAKGGKGARGGKDARRPGRPKAPAAPRPAKILSWREHQDVVLLTLDTVPDRNAAETMRGYEVLVRAEDLPEPDEGQLFLYELEGMGVLLEDGRRLGVIAEVLLPGGQEVWSIETEDGREVLFPVAEQFILAVDEEGDSVTIAPPPGLLELYLDARPGEDSDADAEADSAADSTPDAPRDADADTPE